LDKHEHESLRVDLFEKYTLTGIEILVQWPTRLIINGIRLIIGTMLKIYAYLNIRCSIKLTEEQLQSICNATDTGPLKKINGAHSLHVFYKLHKRREGHMKLGKVRDYFSPARLLYQ